MSITLSGREIRDLANAVGMEISDKYVVEDDILETNMVIMECPKEGISYEDEEGRHHFSHVAYIEEYREEGTFPLGDEIK